MVKILQCFYNFPVWKKMLILFLIFFPLRFAFGVSSEFWLEDELQNYLIGLKFYVGGHWPYFGADVVYTNSQLQGALEGLLIGLPFYIISIPEAPYILLNLLSFFTLFLLGHYIIKYRTPEVPEWFTWSWVFTAPWVVNYSAHVINPSYVLPAAIVFFIAFMEAVPIFRKGFLNYYFAFFLIGFSTFWIFQFHLSWVLLIPFVFFVLWKALQKSLQNFGYSIIAFIFGSLLIGLLIIPTYIKFGISGGSGGATSNIIFNVSNVTEFFAVIVRLFSFACFEITHFIGGSFKVRMAFIFNSWWIFPFIAFGIFTGFAQIIWLFVAWLKKSSNPDMKAMKWLMLALFLITYVSFFFSIKGPSAHTYYLMLPIVMIYAFYCWQPLFKNVWIRRIAFALIISGIVFHITLGYKNFREHSLYKDKTTVVKAIQDKNINVISPRRAFDRNK